MLMIFFKMYNSTDLYSISQVIVAFCLDILIYDLLETRCIDDITITNIFPLFLRKILKMSCRGCDQDSSLKPTGPVRGHPLLSWLIYYSTF